MIGLAALWLAQAAAPFPAPEAVRAMAAGLGGAELVLFEEPRTPNRARVMAAGSSRAPVERFGALLADPAAYRRAVPSFRRAEVVRAHTGGRLVAWELEVPLWNLEGRLWLRPRPDGADLELADGDLSPGLFRVTAQAGDGGTLLFVVGQANLREANFATRRLAARSPLAEPAMAAAAAHLLLRALVLEAERTGAALDPRRRPAAAPGPTTRPLDGTLLGRVAARAGQVVAAVHSRADGRLDRVEVAVPSKLVPDALIRGLAEPQRWKALPGWRQIMVTPRGWEVDTRFPFVDFDATWAIAGPPLRGRAVAGDTKGAVLGWDVVPAGGRSVAVFSIHPRIEKTGYIPRKCVEAEPLLEHGLSLGLAYVDVVSLVRALQGGQ